MVAINGRKSSGTLGNKPMKKLNLRLQKLPGALMFSTKHVMNTSLIFIIFKTKYYALKEGSARKIFTTAPEISAILELAA
jgi:hypothetical protein